MAELSVMPLHLPYVEEDRSFLLPYVEEDRSFLLSVVFTSGLGVVG